MIENIQTLTKIPLKNVWESRRHRAAALSYAISQAEPGVWMEFGVAEGWSANYIIKNSQNKIQEFHLFDSFQGLPEDWDEKHKKGMFKTKNIPQFKENYVKTHVGLFEETLPKIAQKITQKITFIHIDCDLYSSTMTVLNTLNKKIEKGTIIAFDEAIGTPSALENEGKAIKEWQEKNQRTLTPLAKTEYMQLITRVDL